MKEWKQRILRFRVWDKDYRRMHLFGEDCHDRMEFDDRNYMSYTNLQCCMGSNPEYPDSPFLITQDTDLKDNDGKSIFEGDILRHHWDVGGGDWKETVSVVRWSEKTGAFVCDDMKRVDFMVTLHTNHPNAYQTVIGNVFDTPQLIPGVDHLSARVKSSEDTACCTAACPYLFEVGKHTAKCRLYGEELHGLWYDKTCCAKCYSNEAP